MEHVLSKIADVYTKNRRGRVHLTEAFGLSHWSYNVPKDPKQRIYDFYMLSLLGAADENIFFSYIWNNKDPRGPFLNDDQMQDLTFAIRDARSKIIEYNTKDLLDATYFSIASEFKHLYDINSLPDIVKGLQRDGYTIESGIFKKIQKHHQLNTWGYSTSNLSADQIISNYLPPNDPLKLLAIRIQNAYTDPLTGLPGIGVKHDKGYVAAYAAAKKAWQNQDVEFVKLAEHVFRRFKWAGGYGGNKWGDIARGWLMLHEASLKTGTVGESQKMVAIDHIFDLEHNNNVMLDKVQRYKVDGGWEWIKAALDYKAQAMIPVVDFFEKVSYPMRQLVNVLKYVITGIAEDSPYAYQLYDHLAKAKVKTGVDIAKKQDIYYDGSSLHPPEPMISVVKNNINKLDYLTFKSYSGAISGSLLNVGQGIVFVNYSDLTAIKNKILVYIITSVSGYFKLQAVYDCITGLMNDKHVLKEFIPYNIYEDLKFAREEDNKFLKDVLLKGIEYYKNKPVVAKPIKTTFTLPKSLKDVTLDLVREIDKQGEKSEPIIWFKHHYGVPVYSTKQYLYVYIPLLPVIPFTDSLLIYNLDNYELVGLRGIKSGTDKFYNKMIELKGKTVRDKVPISSVYYQYYSKLPSDISDNIKFLQTVSTPSVAPTSTPTSTPTLTSSSSVAPTSISSSSDLKPKHMKIDVEKFQKIADAHNSDIIYNTYSYYLKPIGIENDYIYSIMPQFVTVKNYLFVHDLITYQIIGIYDYIKNISFNKDDFGLLNVYKTDPSAFRPLVNSIKTKEIINNCPTYKSLPTGNVNIDTAAAAVSSILGNTKLPETSVKTSTVGTNATNSTVIGNSGVLLKLLGTVKTTTIAHTGPAGKGGVKTLVIDLSKISSGMGRYKFSGYLKIKDGHSESGSKLYYDEKTVPLGKAVTLKVPTPAGVNQYITPNIGKATVKDLQFDIKAGICRIVSGVIANAVIHNHIVLDGNIVLINCKLDGCVVTDVGLEQIKYISTTPYKVYNVFGKHIINDLPPTTYTGPKHTTIIFSYY